ncbi:MAG TPA: hypothetical protein VL287_15875 [Gemmatimonadales bacterium]|jgi:hypothetical protein|nr:hypothetical protein [Gemmatimonadales bacterium]
MTQLLDRLNRELEVFGKRAQAALDEGRLHMELLRYRRQQDSAARDLGLLVHRRERGQEVDPRRVDAALLRLDDVAVQITRMEGLIEERRSARAKEAAPPPVAQPDQGA